MTTGAGLRGISAVLSLAQELFVELKEKYCSPVHSTIRIWVRKVGLFKLTREKDKGGTWIHIIDATTQMGAMKAVLILGIRLDKARNPLNPTFQEIEPLILKTVTSCSGEVIQEALDEAREKTGTPAAVLSDEGSEMNKGMRLYQSTVPVIHIHDCLHKISNLLKSVLKDNEIWNAFKSNATDTTQKIKLSDIAHLAPPKQRAKSRLMASSSLVFWGESMLNYLDSAPDIADVLKEKINWIISFREDIQEWISMHKLANQAIQTVLEFGYHKDTFTEWKRATGDLECKSTLLQKVHQGIKTIIQAEVKKIPEGAKIPGCTSIIESLFGKFKFLEGQFCGMGLTQLVLALAALAGPVTSQDIDEAMSTIHMNDLEKWDKENLGQTYLIRRREDLPVGNRIT